jgi:cyanophycin synthetase
MSEKINPLELRANQRFLTEEMLSRGISVEVLDWPNEILEARLGDHVELLSDIDSSVMPYAVSIVAGSKSLTKQLLRRAGISVPKGHHFPSESIGELVEYAETVTRYPAVVKPSFGVQGENVFTGLSSSMELRAAIQAIVNAAGNQELVIEEHFEAHEFRVFLTARGRYAVLHREPAFIVGDGVHSIEVLASWESYRRTHPRTNCLCEIALDAEATQYLKRQGLSFDAVPSVGQKIRLRGSSNVKKGGVPTDVTDLVHPSAIEICAKALSALPGLPYAGIDFMCRDIRQKQEGDSYRILEINSVPGIGMHMRPGRGEPRNVAGMIVDVIFPESKSDRRSKVWAA